MSKGIFKVTVKSCNIQNISQLFPDIVLGSPFVEIVFGDQVKRSKPTSNENNTTLTWNESFSFQKTIEYTLSIQILQQSPNGQEILLGSQEIGINTFVRKLSTVDHPVELMNQGLAVCVALLNFEFFPSKGLPQQWLKTRIKQSDGQLHKLLISKMKATIDSSETRPQNKNQCLRVQVGSKFWVTQPSRTPGFNLSWSESFTIVLENNEQELSLEIVDEDGDFPVEQLGQAVLKLQQIKEGSSPNRIPIILEGSQIGFFYFQTEYQVPSQQAISPQLQSKSIQYSSPPRNISGGYKKLGALILSTIKVFLEKNYSAEDAYLSVQWDGQIEKTGQFLGIANKLEWKERLVFTQSSHDTKLTFNLYDKHFAGEEQPLGHSLLFLDQEYQNGGKFRSHKVDIFSEDRSIGQLFVNYEYVFDSIELSEYLKKRAMPSPSDLKKRELLQRRQQIMRPNNAMMNGVSSIDFLPQVEGSANNSIFRSSHNHSIMKSPQPTPAIKSVYSLSLPKLNYDIQVKEYNRLYTDSVFGKGMSNIHSAASLTHSIPSYSLPKAERFPSPSYNGFQSNTYKAPSLFGSDPNDPYVYSKKNIFTDDFKYKVVHRSPAQKSGVSFGIGSRFSSPSKQISPGYYQGPVLFEYNKQ